MKIGDSSRSKARCAMPSLGIVQSIRHEKTGARLNVVTSDRRRSPKRSHNGNGTTDTYTAWSNRDVSCRISLNATAARDELKGTETGEDQPGRSVRDFRKRRSAYYRDRQDIALQTARFLKSRNPNSVVKLKDLETGEETVIAFKSEQ